MSDRTWTVLELLRWTTEHFAAKGIETARLDAEVLLAHALGSKRLGLYLDYDKPVLAEERAAFKALLLRRADERVPVAQLTGRKEFWSLSLEVDSAVLVPRPDTETLVQVALDAVPDREAELRILDLGTGSGAVALALASELPKARVTASDLSGAALAVAARNAEALALADRVRFLEGDAFEPVAGDRFDLVVSNPPYVAERDADSLPPELAHEPREALFGGPDGTDVLRRIAGEVAEVLEVGATVVVEVGSAQAPAMSGWLREAGLGDVQVHRDLAGVQRVVSAVRDQGSDSVADVASAAGADEGGNDGQPS